MSFIHYLLAEEFGVLVAAALATSKLEMIVLMIRSPNKLADD